MISGKNIIGYEWSAEGATTYKVNAAKDNAALDGDFVGATPQEIEQAMTLAAGAANAYRNTSGADKAKFLNAIADEILALDQELVERAMAEAGLPEGRIKGERGRTVAQLRMFANLAEEGSWLDARIDTAIPDRTPAPKADIRMMLRAMGPVVVFGASNFPLAFSTAGGDTASALAAGCPVVVKSHPAHSGTSELVAGAIQKAAKATGMPEGVFSHLNGDGFEVGKALVLHAETKAVAFTGSLRGGRALFDLGSQREEPIPVFAEMGSINPVVLLPEALNNRAEQLATTYAGSITMGVGQFCTNPGLLIGIESDGLNTFISQLKTAIADIAPGCMLHKGIANSYQTLREEVLAQQGVTLEQGNTEDIGTNNGQAAVASVTGATFLNNPALQEEVFGPFSLVVKCADETELNAVLASLSGQLTASFMAEDSELADFSTSIELLEARVGRLIFNAAPTGVEVCPSMHHGGPYPATTDSRFTSVGTGAILRFARPVCYQGWPNSLLPNELQNSNPLNIWRTVDGELSRKTIE